MYVREVKGKVLHFQVSGYLWNRSLVMMDKETQTMWSHILGKGMKGPLEDVELEQIPSVMTDWNSWKQEHPQTTVAVLSKTDRKYNRDFYKTRKLEKFALGFVRNGKARAWQLDALADVKVINETFQGLPVVVAFDPPTFTARLFERKVGDQLLEFNWVEEKLQDRQTQSLWNPVSGRAESGPMEGKQLVPLPAIMSFTHIWKGFHPETSWFKEAGQFSD